MTPRLLRTGTVVAGVSLVLTGAGLLGVRGQDDPRPADRKAREKSETALPPGAKLRLGGGVFRFVPQITLLPPDYKTFLVPDSTGGVRRFEVASGRALDRGTAMPGGMILLSGDGKRFINLRTGNLTIREVESGKEAAKLEVPQGFSTTFASNTPTASISNDGRRVAQGGQSANGFGLAIVFDAGKNEVIFQAPMQYGGPTIPLLSPDGRVLATRRYQRIVRPNEKDDPNAGRAVQIWDVDAGSALFTATVTGGGMTVNGMAFSPDGKTLAASCGDGPIDLWEVPAGKLRTTILGRTRQGQRLAFSADGKTLAALSGEGVIQRWNAETGKQIDSTEWPAEVAMSYPQGLAFAEDNRVVAWGACGPVPVVWEAPSGKVLSPLPEHTGAIKAIAFAAGGKELVTAAQDGRIMRWEASTGKPLGPIALKSGRARTPIPMRNLMAMSPDGSRAIVAGLPAAVYDLASGTELFAVPGGPSPGGFTIVVPTQDLSKAITVTNTYDRKSRGAAAVWDLVEPRKLGEVEMESTTGAVPAAALSPDGTRLIVAAHVVPAPPATQPKMTITAWDLKTGKRLSRADVAKWTGQTQLAAADETTAVLADGSGKLRRYDFARGKFGEDLEPVATSFETPSPIVFNPERTRFAVGVAAGETGSNGVRIHEWPSGKVLHTFRGHPSQITALTFSADGKRLASGSFDATVLVWDLEGIKEKE